MLDQLAGPTRFVCTEAFVTRRFYFSLQNCWANELRTPKFFQHLMNFIIFGVFLDPFISNTKIGSKELARHSKFKSERARTRTHNVNVNTLNFNKKYTISYNGK